MRDRLKWTLDGLRWNWKQITGQFKHAPEVKYLSFQQYRKMYCPTLYLPKSLRS